MRNAYYARDNFDVRRGGRGFSCAVKNTLISQKDAVDTRTFRVKPNTPKLLSMPGKNGGQLWDLPSISMDNTQNALIYCINQAGLGAFTAKSGRKPGVALALKFLGSMKIFADPFESAKNNF